MKRFINLLFLFGLITVFNASSCNKPDPETELPTSENTAYYYLEGQLIVPTGRGIVPPIIPAISFYNNSNNYFRLSFSSEDPSLDVDFYINGVITSITYFLNECTPSNCDENYAHLSLPINHTWTDFKTKDNTGNLKITYLSENKRQFKGTFEMDVYDSNGNVKHITGGHFNINLDTLNN
jgi:hypothetical protein